MKSLVNQFYLHPDVAYHDLSSEKRIIFFFVTVKQQEQLCLFVCSSRDLQFVKICRYKVGGQEGKERGKTPNQRPYPYPRLQIAVNQLRYPCRGIGSIPARKNIEAAYVQTDGPSRWGCATPQLLHCHGKGVKLGVDAQV